MDHPLHWLDDRVYLDLMRIGLQRDGAPDMFRTQRFSNLLQAFQTTFDLEGDTAEAGCLFGLATFMMCGYEKARNSSFNGAGHHLFDSFIGLSFPDQQDLQQSEPNEWLGIMLGRRKTTTGKWPAGQSFLKRTQEVLADYPGLTCNDDFWLKRCRDARAAFAKDPASLHTYSAWDEVPGSPRTRERWGQWLARYRPLVEEGTRAWLGIRDSDLFAAPLPAEVVASAFANRRFRLVLANHGRAPAEIATAEAWLRDDAPGPAATRFTLPPRSLAILERPVGV